MENLQTIYEQALQMTHKGKVATYIPALADANPATFAVSLLSMEDQIDLGDCTNTFTLQSVVKVLSFMVAANHHGINEILKYVDVEPTGDSFNSIVRLESNKKSRSIQ